MTNTQQTNWYQNLSEITQWQTWYQTAKGLLQVSVAAGALLGFGVLVGYLNPTPFYPQNQLINLTHALQVEQHNNPSNAQAIANQFGGMSNLEQAVSNYDSMTPINVNHPSLPNFNNGNTHLDSLVSETNNSGVIINLTYHTHQTQPVSGTKGLICELVAVQHTMAISQHSINEALQQAPSKNVKGGN